MAQHIDENRLVHDNRALAKSELTAVQAHILQYILGRSESGTTLTAIHREFDCSMGSLSCILKRLREKGYIRIEGCKSDDRQKLIFATEKGEESSAFLNRALGSVKKRAYGCFTASELAQLDGLQKKMLRNLSELAKSRQLEGSER